jgi:hypothetical protein
MDKNKEIKIEKMVLNIEGEKINLTIEQAKKLKDVLDELFKKEIIREVVHEHHHDWWWKSYPQYTVGTQKNPLDNQIYCAGNTVNLTI